MAKYSMESIYLLSFTILESGKYGEKEKGI